MFEKLKNLFEVRNTDNLVKNMNNFSWQTPNVGEDAANVSKENAIKVSTIFACISIRANALAKLPIHVFKSNKNGKEKIDTDISYLLKTRPNTNMSAFKFKQTLSVILDLFGNCYVWMESKKGKIVALWILPPEDTELKDVKGKNWIITKLNDKDYKLKYEEVLHFSDISINGEGISKIDVAKELIGNIKGSYNLMKAYYKNGSVAKGVLSTTATLDKDAKIAIKNAWSNSSGNLDIGGVAIVDNGLEFKPTISSFTDYQFVDLVKLTKEDIAMIYNVPVHMLNQLDKATFSNIENLNLQFFQSTVQPLVTMLEDEMNYKLFSEIERVQNYFVKFNTNAMLRADTTARTSFYKEMLNNGVMSINEVRELEDLNRIDDGDENYRSLNYVPLSIANDYQLSKAGVDNSSTKGGDTVEK